MKKLIVVDRSQAIICEENGSCKKAKNEAIRHPQAKEIKKKNPGNAISIKSKTNAVMIHRILTKRLTWKSKEIKE